MWENTFLQFHNVLNIYVFVFICKRLRESNKSKNAYTILLTRLYDCKAV